MTRRESHQTQSFIALCSSLTKQGFTFSKSLQDKFSLVFHKHDLRRLLNPYTKTPYVNSFSIKQSGKQMVCVKFNQW